MFYASLARIGVYSNLQMDRKTGAPMVKLFEDKMGGREAEVVLDDPRSGAGIVSWFNGIIRLLPKFHSCTWFF